MSTEKVKINESYALSPVVFANSYIKKFYVSPFSKPFKGENPAFWFFILFFAVFISLAFVVFADFSVNKENMVALIAAMYFFEILIFFPLFFMKTGSESGAVAVYENEHGKITAENGKKPSLFKCKLDYLQKYVHSDGLDDLINDYKELIEYKEKTSEDKKIFDFILSKDAKPRILSLIIFFMSLCAVVLKDKDSNSSDIFGFYVDISNFFIEIASIWVVCIFFILLVFFASDMISSFIGLQMAVRSKHEKRYNSYAVQYILRDLIIIKSTEAPHKAINEQYITVENK